MKWRRARLWQTQTSKWDNLQATGRPSRQCAECSLCAVVISRSILPRVVPNGGSARVIRWLIDHSAHHSQKVTKIGRRRTAGVWRSPSGGGPPRSRPVWRRRRPRPSGTAAPPTGPAARPARPRWSPRRSRPPRPAGRPGPGQRAEFGQRGRLLVLGERAPPRAMPRLAGQLSHHNPVGISPGTILVHLARIEHDYVNGNVISGNNIRSGSLYAQSPGAASTAATGRGPLEVLAGVLIACGWVRAWQVIGDIGRADGGRVEGLRAGGDAASLAGDGLGEQLDGKASVEPDNASSNRPCGPVRHPPSHPLRSPDRPTGSRRFSV
jgi:hypothetical protein